METEARTWHRHTSHWRNTGPTPRPLQCRLPNRTPPHRCETSTSSRNGRRYRSRFPVRSLRPESREARRPTESGQTRRRRPLRTNRPRNGSLANCSQRCSVSVKLGWEAVATLKMRFRPRYGRASGTFAGRGAVRAGRVLWLCRSMRESPVCVRR